MLRTLYSVAITIAFVAMMFFLFRDQVIPSMRRGAGGVDVDRRILTDGWADIDDWQEIRLGDFKLGALRTVTEKDDASDGYTAAMQLEIRTSIQSGRIISTARMNRRLEVETTRVRAHFPRRGATPLTAEQLMADALPAGAYELSARVDGNLLRWSLRHDDAVTFGNSRLAAPITVADSLGPALRGEMLSRGVTYAIDVYDPLFRTDAGKVQIQYLDDEEFKNDEGKTERARRVEMRFQNARMIMVIDRNGSTLRREIPLLQGTGADAANTADATLIFQKSTAQVLLPKYPELDYDPPQPKVSVEQVTGENKGNVFTGFSIFNLVGKAIAGK